MAAGGSFFPGFWRYLELVGVFCLFLEFGVMKMEADSIMSVQNFLRLHKMLYKRFWRLAGDS